MPPLRSMKPKHFLIIREKEFEAIGKNIQSISNSLRPKARSSIVLPPTLTIDSSNLKVRSYLTDEKIAESLQIQPDSRPSRYFRILDVYMNVLKIDEPKLLTASD
jgi:hypothetical protein